MRGYVEKRGEKTYRVRVDLGSDETGRRRSKSETVHGTKREAQKRLVQLMAEAEAGAVITAAPQTLGEFLDYWLANYAKKLATRTYHNYGEYVRHYIKPRLGQIRLDQLQPHHIQAFYTSLEESGSAKKGTGLSPTTVFNCHRVLKGALKRAVQWQLLSRNPAEAVTPPRPVEREQRVIGREQVTVLLQAAKDCRLYAPILIGLATGMRRGEICGLRWQDVNFEKSTLAVRQTLVSVGQKQLEFKTPKTKAGRRVVKLPTMLVEALQEERAVQEQARHVLGPTYNPLGLVVCRADGSPVHPATLYSRFQQLLERLGLPRVAIHDLRHSHATHLLEAGINPKVVSERLGHTDPALTLRVYSHVLDHIQQEAADQTDLFLRPGLRNVNGDPDIS
jgi:integrase